jgi:hypothetical protein
MVSLKLKLIVIGAAIGFDYVVTTIMNFLGIDPSLYGNYLTFWNALVIFWVVLPSRIDSPLDGI